MKCKNKIQLKLNVIKLNKYNNLIIVNKLIINKCKQCNNDIITLIKHCTCKTII